MIRARTRHRRVLVVDRDPGRGGELEGALALRGFGVSVAATGDEALQILGRGATDAAILADAGAVDVCRRLRTTAARLPIVILTAWDSAEERVRGLDADADDCLGRPFVIDELVARLHALIRRTGGCPAAVLRFEDLTLDEGAYEVRQGGRRLALTPTEYRVLRILLLNPRRVITREALFERVWPRYDIDPSSNALAVYISSLRRKLEEGGEPRLIHTVRGVGYCLREGMRLCTHGRVDRDLSKGSL
jgi:two-component system, OmpR family, response regulator MprA